jgi:hypothetical protein
MGIFQKPIGLVHYFDQITIGSYTFDISVSVQSKRGDPSAIHCGRIVSLTMTCEHETVALFDEGNWYEYPADDFGEGCLAVQMAVNEWDKDKPRPFINRGKIPYGYF